MFPQLGHIITLNSPIFYVQEIVVYKFFPENLFKELANRNLVRSLTYVFGGKPSNIDDCIDYATRNEPPTCVSLKLEKKETVNYGDESVVIDMLIATYTWKFPKLETYFKVEYGGIFSHESHERRIKSVDNANERLKIDLERLTKRDINVINSDARF